MEELDNVAGLARANTSQHLQPLRQTGLVRTRKEGLRVYYRLSGDDVILLLEALRVVAERHVAEVKGLINTCLSVKDCLEPVPRAELLTRVRDGRVTVLDVRPREEFAAGHVPGAVNIPLAELEQQLEKLGEDRVIVAYGRGPHRVLAFDVVARLREKGLKARRLEDGYPEWRAEGLPVETRDNTLKAG